MYNNRLFIVLIGLMVALFFILLIVGVVLLLVFLWIKRSKYFVKKVNPGLPFQTLTAKVLSKGPQIPPYRMYSIDVQDQLYSIVFQIDNDERLALKVPGNIYGLIVEGDEGDLTYQNDLLIKFLIKK